MNGLLRGLLVDPVSHEELTFRPTTPGAQDGVLLSARGDAYPVTNGIPRLLPPLDVDQTQTSGSFGFKWSRSESFGSPRWQETYRTWLVEKYGFESVHEMRAFFAGRRVLDVGTGAGMASAVWLDDTWPGELWIGLDISSSVDIAKERLGSLPGTAFVQADALHLPFRAGSFDVVFSEGVLHHTRSTREAIASVARVLVPAGEALFYVYRKKAPGREFVDDYVRSLIVTLDPGEAWKRLGPLTRLAQALAELKVDIEVPEDVPLLGIRAGRYDIQRFIYWHFAKLFWNDALSFEENLHVNFDWYHPRYAHRQTEEEVRAWCDSAGLDIVYLRVEESGFTVRAHKR